DRLGCGRERRDDLSRLPGQDRLAGAGRTRDQHRAGDLVLGGEMGDVEGSLAVTDRVNGERRATDGEPIDGGTSGGVVVRQSCFEIVASALPDAALVVTE